MRFALPNCRSLVGLSLAISLVATGPLTAFSQNASMRPAPSGYPRGMSPAAGIRNSSGAQPNRESLLGDHRFNWKMPFTRDKKETTDAQAQYQHPPMTRSIPRAELQGPTSADRQPNRPTIPANAVLPPSYTTRGNNSPQSAVHRSAPAQSGQRIASRASVAPATAEPAVQASRDLGATAPQQAAESPAVRLLAQAHNASATARTESEYSQIIVACEQANSGRPTPAVSRYANELCSWALNRRGQVKAEAGLDAEAIADFDAAIKADPKRWRAIHNRGVLLAQKGEFERAFDDFTHTIQINPQFAKAYSNRGALFIVAGQIEPAIEDFKRAIAIDPDLSVAHRGLGRACHLDGKLDDAVSHYDEAIRLSPNDAYAIASRADVLTDLGRYAEALSEYERGINADPQSGHAYSGSAWLLATCPDDSVRNPELAVERAEMAVKLAGPEDAASLDTLAAAQASAGDFNSAKTTIAKAVSVATDEEKQAYQQRLALYEQGKPYRHAPLSDVVQTSHEE